MTAIGAGGMGKIRAQLRAALAEARAAERMTTEHEIRAVLAERYAAVADTASAAGDERKLLQVGGKLLDLLDTLPIRSTKSAGGGSAGDGSSSGGAPVLELFEGGPTMGDGTHT